MYYVFFYPTEFAVIVVLSGFVIIVVRSLLPFSSDFLFSFSYFDSYFGVILFPLDDTAVVILI